MRQLIIRLGLAIGPFLSKLGITKAAGKAFGKEFAKNVAMGWATEKLFSVFRKEQTQEMARAESDVVNRSSSLKRKLAGGFVAGAITAIGAASVSSAKRFKDFMDQTGKSAQEVQETDNVMKRNGQTMEGFVSKIDAIGEARKDAVESNTQLRDTFRDFGVTLDDLRNPMMSNLDLAKKMGVALRGMAPTDEQRNSLRELLGKNGEQFLTALKGMGDKSPLDIFANESAIKNIDRANTLIGSIWQSIKNIGTNTIGGGLGKLFGMAENIGDSPDKIAAHAQLLMAKYGGKTSGAIGGALFGGLAGHKYMGGLLGTLAGAGVGALAGGGIGNEMKGDVDLAEFNYRNADKIAAIKRKDADSYNPGGKNFVGPDSAPFFEQQRKDMFRLKEEKELGKLAHDLAAEQKKTDFDRLNRLEKEKSLQKDIHGFLAEADFAESQGFGVEAAGLRIDAENKQQQLDDLQRQPLPNLQKPYETDALAKNNRFVGLAGGDFTIPIMLQIQRDQLNVLKSIDKKITPGPPPDPLAALNAQFR